MPLDPDDAATTARDLMLDRMWATAPGALVEVGLRNASGVELDPVDCPGYARYVVSWSGFWAAASGGAKASVSFALCTPSAEWADAGYQDCIYVDGYAFDSAPLTDPVVVTAAGDPVDVQLVRAFSDLVV